MRSILFQILNFFYCLIFPFSITKKGKNCHVIFCDGHSISGKDNKIIFKDGVKLYKCCFTIKGNNNTIIIGNHCIISKTNFWVLGNGNKIEIGDKTTVGRNTEFATLEGTNITIGQDCMFSHDILVRTSDSHSIVNEKGERINKSKDINIGNHCWIGLQCLILKGSSIADNSILAARSMLNKQFEEEGCIIGGAPAKLLKQHINWDRKKL